VPAVHSLSARYSASAAPPERSAVPAAPVEPTIAAALPAQASAEPEAVVVPSAAPTLSAVAPRSEQKSAPLSAELSALDAARSSLVAGDPTTALSALDAYSRKFPRGRLSLEAEVLRIDALAKSGQTAAARQRASAFIRRHPDSVLATRVRAFAGQ
jgi:TolA-binding protein